MNPLLLDRARTALGGRPDRAWWVPGRLEVFGKHTDYAGGRSLVCAIDRGLAIAMRMRDDNQVRVIAAGGGTGHEPYAQTVIRRLALNFPEADRGADIAFASDLPDASGLSSSSALVVGIATALVRARGIDASDDWRLNVPDALSAAGYFACIENGMSFGTLVGETGVGTHGGSEDHAAILTGKEGRLGAFSFVPMRLIGQVAAPERWTFVIAVSGARAEKTRGARERYNRLSAAAQTLLALWNDVLPNQASLAAALSRGEDAVSALHARIDAACPAGWVPGDLHRRLDHFVREDARVPEAVAAFAATDRDALAALSAASQDDADALLENQVEETRALAAAARRNGAFASCSFGAGFGGSVWALIEAPAAARFARAWNAGAFLTRPSAGLTEIA